MTVPIWIFIVFQQRVEDEIFKILIMTLFCRLPVVSAQAVLETEKYPDACILSNYDDGDYSQGYAQVKKAFRASTKVDNLQPYINNDNSRTLNVTADDVGYSLYNFEKKISKKFTAPQLFEVEIKFDGVVPNDINACDSVLANHIVSISSVGKKLFQFF